MGEVRAVRARIHAFGLIAFPESKLRPWAGSYDSISDFHSFDVAIRRGDRECAYFLSFPTFLEHLNRVGVFDMSVQEAPEEVVQRTAPCGRALMQKKICLLGTFAVGKSSLTERFVKSIFSERYHTTVGVHVHKRTVELDSGAIDLIIWDLAGEDEFVSLRTAYLRGAGGYILADGTRRETLRKAIEMQKCAGRALGGVPFVLMVNKTDLQNEWAVQDADLEGLTRQGWTVFRTSAKTGEGVSDGFIRLAAAVGRGQAYMARRSR